LNFSLEMFLNFIATILMIPRIDPRSKIVRSKPGISPAPIVTIIEVVLVFPVSSNAVAEILLNE